jgi:hypothetical protein
LKCLITYPKFRSRRDPRRPGSASHRPLLPDLDLSSTNLGISIRVAVNPMPLLMNRSFHNMFPDIGYVFTEGFPKIHPEAPRNACGVRTAAG